MKFALCLFRYFPYSGLANDFLMMAKQLYKRGHHVDCYVYEWQGERPNEDCDRENKKAGQMNIFLLPTKKLSNHNKDAYFYTSVKPYLESGGYDAVVGFNKMPGLDIYYMGDFCYADRVARKYNAVYFLTKMLPRAHHFTSFEKAVFNKDKQTKILSISDLEKAVYQRAYKTDCSRFYNLPPRISDNLLHYQENYHSKREYKRYELELKKDTWLILFVGSGFKTKGLDRAIESVAKLKEAGHNNFKFMIAGQDDSDAYQRIVDKHNLNKDVIFLGGRTDIFDLMTAADVLIHPAYRETTGMVLLEAVTLGLPVLATEHCGYANHIKNANAGIVLCEPITIDSIYQALLRLLTLEADVLETMQRSARAYGHKEEFRKMPDFAIDIIENIAQNIDRKEVTKTPHTNILTASSYHYVYRYYYKYHNQDINQLINKPDAEIESDVRLMLKNDQTSTVVVKDLNCVPIVIKRYNTKNFWHIIKRSVRRTRASNCWYFANFLIKNNVNTPHPVAYRENRVGLLRRRSYYLCEYVKGKTLVNFLDGKENRLAKLELVAKAINAFFVQMESLKLSHGDMKASNFIINDKGEFYVLDLDGMRSYYTKSWTRYKLFRDKRRFMQNWINDKTIYEFFYQHILTSEEKTKIPKTPDVDLFGGSQEEANNLNRE